MKLAKTLRNSLVVVMVLLWTSVGLNAREAGLFDDLFCKGIHADLREPSYEDGTLRTTQGGVISGPDLRIQAMDIVYTRKMIDDKPCFKIEAEGLSLIHI